MGHVGIIAEYNPFHNGHFFQLQKAKELFPNKDILVVMSGDYVQRGEPAIYNKYIRCKQALSCGVSMVLELPSIFSCATALHFSRATVLSLAATGIIDTLCFGAETDDIDSLKKIAKVFIEEPKPYQEHLNQALKNGHAYPKARSLALEAYTKDSSLVHILRQPNNSLAIGYIETIMKYNLKIEPVLIKRTGNDYHSLDTQSSLCSASALRKIITKSNNASLNSLEPYIPAPALNVLKNDFAAHPLTIHDFANYINYALWENNQYNTFCEINNALSNRIIRNCQNQHALEQQINLLTSRNFTIANVQRGLMHIVLKHTKEELDYYISKDYITYLRILGIQKESCLPKQINQYAKVPIINKVTKAKDLLDKETLQCFEKEIQRNQLYRLAYFNKYNVYLPIEYEKTIIVQ